MIARMIWMDREYALIIVNRILSLCNSRRLSVNKRAEMSGVSQSTLDNLVNGKTFNPQIRTLHKIALAFGMTAAEFLDYPELNNYSFEEQAGEFFTANNLD